MNRPGHRQLSDLHRFCWLGQLLTTTFYVALSMRYRISPNGELPDCHNTVTRRCQVLNVNNWPAKRRKLEFVAVRRAEYGL